MAPRISSKRESKLHDVHICVKLQTFLSLMTTTFLKSAFSPTIYQV